MVVRFRGAGAPTLPDMPAAFQSMLFGDRTARGIVDYHSAFAV